MRDQEPPARPVDADVVIVGCGPVGQLLAILLGQRGHSVLLLDQWTVPYPRPRAVQYDDEIARVFAAAGVQEQVAAVSVVGDSYEWRNQGGQTLLRFDLAAPGPSGYPRSNAFSQPELEAVLAERISELPTIRVVRGEAVVDVANSPDHVRVVSHGPTLTQHRWTARYAVGADGASSLVRERMRAGVVDLGFFYDWLIVDVRLDDDRVFDPLNLQICDPARPTTVVCSGVGRRRWEFMRLPQEHAAELESPGRIWELLAAHDVTPANAVIERSVVYTFQARWVDQWRKGRIFLAGDAAHLMPPFWGQGLCSGLRDAANLAWKLDLVLSGRSDDALLDTYTSERSAHVQHAVHISVALGNIICVTDPQEAAERDAAMLAAGADPARILAAGPPARLGPGVLQTLPDGTLPPGVGVATPHPRVQANGVTGLSDDVVGRGFLVAAVVDPRPLLSPAQRDLLERLGARVVHLVAAGAPPPTDPDVVVDVDGALLAQLAGCGAEAVIVRPDAYLFGAVTDARDLPALVDELRDLLQVAPELPVPPDLQVEQELQAEQEQ